MSLSRLDLWIGSVAATLVIWSPGAARACSVCSAGRDDETRAAFIATTGFLTLLPLVMIGGLLWWLRRRARAMEQSELAEAPLDLAEAPLELAEAPLDPVSRTSSLP